MAADEKTLEALLAQDRQRQTDILEVLHRGLAYQEANATAAHGILAALAELKEELTEIRELLVVDVGDDGAPDLQSVADCLASIAADVTEIGVAANLLAVEDEAPA